MLATLRGSRMVRLVAATVTATTLLWYAPGEAFADHTSKGLRTQTPDARLRAKIAAKQERADAAAHPDVRSLSANEMNALRGRGPYRSKYFSGVLPWQRSFRDANLCNGNLFKSFTDVQVAPAKGAGLVLQRTYNSNDERMGPFGVGWTHAYDIRMEETAETDPTTGDEIVTRTDFFGGKHKYARDADGLYSPPAYLFDETDSKYAEFLANGPSTEVLEDTQRGMDGTIKHFVSAGTDPDGSPSASRVCDYIEDRHGNRTNLTYASSLTLASGQTLNNPVPLASGGTTKLLTQVTDPSGRSLAFTWTNLGTTSAPAYRITQVQGPVYRVTYDYYNTPGTLASHQNLWKVHLDTDGLNRVTTYTYTSYSSQNGMENGLLASIADPLGNAVSYQYSLEGSPTGTLWVSQVSEPGSGTNQVWTISPWGYNTPTQCMGNGLIVIIWVSVNLQYQATRVGGANGVAGGSYGHAAYSQTYDSMGNVIWSGRTAFNEASDPNDLDGVDTVNDIGQDYTYGPHGNVLTAQPRGFTGSTTNYAYYNASKYFQKSSVTDPLGRVTSFDYFDKFDPSAGNRGNVAWVRDAGYSVSGSPSQNKQFTYTYNGAGQKASETNLNGVVTNYAYGDSWGNLTQVVQDAGTGKLNRTTVMAYDAGGRVTSSTDPMGRQSTFFYNNLGQPTSAAFPATTGTPSTPAETITYTYGGNGRTETVTDGRGQTTLVYETGNDRVSSVTDPVTGTLSYTYGLTGERASMTMPGGGTITYQYQNWTMLPKDDPNSIGRQLKSITDDQGRQVRYYLDVTSGSPREVWSNQTFDGSGNLTSYLKTRYEPDQSAPDASGTVWSHGWLKQIKTTWHWKTQTMYGSQWNQRVAVQNDYTYDNGTGQRLTNALSDNTGLLRTEQYGYDEVNRLKTVNYGDGQTQSYAFDATGNRSSRTDSAAGTENYTFDNANRLLTRAGNTYTNDLAGNTLSGGARTNTWDSQNRLVQCVNGTTTSTFKYGSDGLRRQMTSGGTTTDFALDGQSVVREMRAGATYATYLSGVRGPEYRRDASGTVRWYLYDGLGSVQGEVDGSGNVTASRKFDVYGLVRGSTGTSTSKHKFVGGLGHTSEDETGLVYMRARYYDPVVGRFASEDPAHDGGNWFAYCGNNPVNFVDSAGTEIEQSGIAAWLVGQTLAATSLAFAYFREFKEALAFAGLAIIAFAVAMIESPTSKAFQYGSLAYAILLGGSAGIVQGALSMVMAAGEASKAPFAGVVIASLYVYGFELLGAMLAQDMEASISGS